MAQTAFWHGGFRPALLTGVVAWVPAGCVDATGGRAIFAPAAGAKASAGADVEAPEVFQVTDTALWDGRPSLGGIWVASPDAVDPERVLMENTATGATVEGALFRRERDNPGPALQISSDAAEALGLLAGQPAEVRVTALRTADPEPALVEDTAPVDPAAEIAAEETPEVPIAESADADADAEATAAAATAALAATDGAATDEAATDGAAADGAVAPADAPPLTAKERRAAAKAEREAKRAANAAAKAEAAATADTGKTAVEGGVVAVETAPLDARSADVSVAAAAAVTVIPDPGADTATPTPEATADTAAGPAAEPATGTTARPIQIATFSLEENATRAIADLAKLGVTAQVRKAEVGGKPVWGIMANDDVATLKSIRGAGYPDAYFLQ